MTHILHISIISIISGLAIYSPIGLEENIDSIAHTVIQDSIQYRCVVL